VIDGRTGLFFDDPTAASLAEALRRVPDTTFDASFTRSWAEGFSQYRHVAALTAAIDDTLSQPIGTRW
jgi:hypothetical protein